MRNSFNDMKFNLFKFTTLIVMSEIKVIASNVKVKLKLQISKTVLLSELILNLNLIFAVQSSHCLDLDFWRRPPGSLLIIFVNNVINDII